MIISCIRQTPHLSFAVPFARATYRCVSTTSCEDSSKSSKLYNTHIPVPARQKFLIAVGSAFAALHDPMRGDMVAALGETTGHSALVCMRDRMLLDSTGRQILRDRPLINSRTIDLDRLHQLPNGTFGREYVRWLDIEGVTPDTRDRVHFIDDSELAYVMCRYRESHDFFHTLTGLPVTVEGELALKWFEMIQTGLPMTALSSFFGPLRLTSEERKRLFKYYVPWAIQCASSAKYLMNIYFERMFERPLSELRTELGIYLPPLQVQNNSSL